MDIMYFVMDAHSFYNFIYFILLIIVSVLMGTRGCGVAYGGQAESTVNVKAALTWER